MGSVERFQAAWNGTGTDRTPLMPVMPLQGARALGLPLESYLRDPTRLAAGQLALLERLPLDAVFSFPHYLQDLLAWGGGLDFQDEGPPTVARRATSHPDKLLKGPVPQATDHDYLAHSLQAARRLSTEVGGRLLVVGAVVGPASLPSLLMGPRRFLALLHGERARRSRYLPRVMERMIEFSSRWANAQFDAGCDLVLVIEPMTTSTLLDEGAFLSCAHPALKVFSRRCRGPLALQLMGPCLKYLPHLQNLEMVALALAEEDSVDSARRALGSGKAIIGSLSNRALLRDDPMQIEQKSRRLIKIAGPGFVLGNHGSEVPWQVPEENLQALFRAVHAPRQPASQPAATLTS